jgi:hypothetical protein
LPDVDLITEFQKKIMTRWKAEDFLTGFTIPPKCASMKKERFLLQTEAIAGFKYLRWLNKNHTNTNALINFTSKLSPPHPALSPFGERGRVRGFYYLF